VTFTATQREALTTMAAHPPERPYVLYRTKAGPMLMRITQTWLAVPQAQVDRLVSWGLLVEQGPYWTITETGRAAVAEPVPARSGRRRSRARDGGQGEQ
jgi:hypothetical protein